MNPIRRKIYHHLTRQIAEQKLTADDQLPTEMELVEQFQTTRNQVYGAVSQLAREGLVRRNKRQGTLVNPDIFWPVVEEAKNLSAHQVHLIASLDKALPFQWSARTIDDLRKVLHDHDLELHQTDLPESRQDLEQLMRQVNNAGTAAVLFMPGVNEDEYLLDHAEAILEYRGDVYLFSRGATSTERWPFHSIQFDPFGQGVVAARYLYEGGHRELVFASRMLPEDQQFFWQEKRLNGLQAELRCISRGNQDLTIWKLDDEHYAEQAVNQLLAAERPLVLLAPNDSCAAAIMERASTASLRVPEDFMLIAFDNSPISDQLGLTTVAPPADSVGHLLGRLICHRRDWLLDGEKVAIKLPNKVIQRRTCFPLES